MPRLYHPELDRTHDFGSERSAKVARRSGWVTEDEHRNATSGSEQEPGPDQDSEPEV